MGIRKKLKRALPYWLTGRDERCAGCGHHHAHGTSAHCAGCDRPFCPVCVTVVDGEVFCAECQDKGGSR